MHWGWVLVATGFVVFLALRRDGDEPRTAWEFTRLPLAWAVLLDLAGVGWRGDVALVAVLLVYLVLPVGLVALFVGRYAQGLPWVRVSGETAAPSAPVLTEAVAGAPAPDDASPVTHDVAAPVRRKSTRTMLMAGGVFTLAMALAVGVWWLVPPRDPDFGAYDECLLRHVAIVPASTPDQYQATLAHIRAACRRLHPVELDIEVLARANPGKKHWDEKVPEIIVDLVVDGWPDGVSPEGLRDSYFTQVIRPRIHPDWEPEVRVMWNKRAQAGVDLLNAAFLRSRDAPSAAK